MVQVFSEFDPGGKRATMGVCPQGCEAQRSRTDCPCAKLCIERFLVRWHMTIT
jgi:hypothetical protein